MTSERETVTYVDMTPTWEGLLPVLLEIYCKGSSKGKADILLELQRMAKAADMAVAASKIGEARHV